MPALLHARPPTDPTEERRLRKLAAAHHAPASWIQRARIITGSWDGASVAELARRLGCHPKTVPRWLPRSNPSGIDALADLPRPGVPRRISEHQRGHRPQPGPPDPVGGGGALAAHAVVGDQHRSRVRPKRAQVIACYTTPPEETTVICADELGPVIPRSFPPAPAWTPDGHRVKAPLATAAARRRPGRTARSAWLTGRR